MASGDDLQTIWLPNSHMRERAQVPATNVAALDAVKGFLTPRYSEYHPETGKRVWELHQADLNRVADGYACGNCLAFFDRRFRLCPACRHELDPNRDIIEYAPPHWYPSEGRTSDQVIEETTF